MVSAMRVDLILIVAAVLCAVLSLSAFRRNERLSDRLLLTAYVLVSLLIYLEWGR